MSIATELLHDDQVLLDTLHDIGESGAITLPLLDLAEILPRLVNIGMKRGSEGFQTLTEEFDEGKSVDYLVDRLMEGAYKEDASAAAIILDLIREATGQDETAPPIREARFAQKTKNAKVNRLIDFLSKPTTNDV